MNQTNNPAEEIATENHPLAPFLPQGAQLLMLGSFPPPQKRWCMDFFYPNFINDMWRIMGLLFFHDKDYLVDTSNKCFKKEIIIDLLTQKGIALYDTAYAVKRLQDNASDKFLEIVTPTDLALLLDQIPSCKAVVTTGQKATETFCSTWDTPAPKIGEYHTFSYKGREIRHYRMPSSSRAYPMNLSKKATYYLKMMQELNMID